MRAFDIIAALAALLVLALPFAVLIVVLRCTGEGKVWFRQPRVGRDGEIFRVFKFVTMRSDSEWTGNKDITVRGDPRVLPVGRFLRWTKLNELPQFINVLTGDMSLVGWRPLVPSGFADYTEPIQKQIVRIRPGVTGVGSLVFRDEEALVSAASEIGKEAREVYREEILPFKGELELWYQENRSLGLDLRILIATAVLVVFSRASVWSLIPSVPKPGSPFLRRHLLDR